MQNHPWRILLVEDDEDDYILTREYLKETSGTGFKLEWVRSAQAALEKLEGQDVLLVDYGLGDTSGLDLVRMAVAEGCKAPIILLSGQGNYDVDLEAMQAGATDYVSKSELTPSLLERAIRYSIERKRIEEALVQARSKLEQRVLERTRELSEANANLAAANAHLEKANAELKAEVAERQRVEGILRESENRLRAVVDGAPIILWSVDRQGRITLLEGKGLASMGSGSDQLLGAATFERLGDDAGIKQAIQRAMEGEEVVAISHEDLSQGEIFETRYAPHYDGQGQIIGVIGVSTVITERVRAQEQIAYQAYLLEQVSDAIIATDEDFNFTAWNSGAEQIYGWKAEELLGQKSYEYLKTRAEDMDRDEIARTVLETGQFNGEVIHQRKDGRSIYVESKTILLMNDDGQITGYLAVNRDITSRKEAEEHERKSARRTAGLAELSQALAETGPDEQKLYEVIVCKVVDVLGDTSTLSIISEDGEFVEPKAHCHLDPEIQTYLKSYYASTRFPLGEGIPGQVIETGQPFMYPETDSDPPLTGRWPQYQEYHERFGLYSLLAVPLRVQGSIIGILAISRTTPDQPYTLADQEFLQDLAGRAAMAITNARLFKAVESELGERQRAENALRASTAMFEGLFESAPDAIVLVDPVGNILSFNRQTVNTFGYAPLELEGLPVETLLPGAQGPFTTGPDSRPVILGLDLYAVRRDGRRIPVDVTLSPLLLNDSVHVICIIHDITNRKQAEDALRKSEARFRTIFEEAAIGIKLKDLEGRVIAANPALQEMLGYSEVEMFSMGLDGLVHPADLDRNQRLFQLMVEGKIPGYRLETRYLHKDGSVTWVRLAVSIVRDDAGEPQFSISMIENINERKLMEADLKEVQRRLMDSRESERLTLSQDLHDGPMQTLYGLTYQVKSLYDDMEGDPYAEKLVGMQETITEVIQVLRVICGELRPPTLTPFGLEKTIRSHAEKFRREYPDLDFVLDLEPDRLNLPENVRLALFRIYQQSLMNIVRHAQATRVTIRFAFSEEDAMLEIQDNGVGFEVPEHWIDFVRQGHLGLAGISERAEAVGGRLTVISAPGKGSAIQVDVPLINPEVGLSVSESTSPLYPALPAS